MKSISIMVIFLVAISSFFSGYYVAFKNVSNKNREIKDNIQSGDAIYNLFIFSRIRESVKKNDIADIDELIAVQMSSNVKKANDGNKEVSTYMNAEYADLICRNLKELNVLQGFPPCNQQRN